MTKNELDHLYSFINKDSIVLEIGSGYSTLELSKRAKFVVSIEHNDIWYNKIKEELKDIENVAYCLRRPNKHFNEGGEDGDWGSFKDYLNLVSSYPYNSFDIVIIDGRARVECAYIGYKYYPKATYFLHDYQKPEDYNGGRSWRKGYERVLDIFTLIEKVDSLAKFEVKKSLKMAESFAFGGNRTLFPEFRSIDELLKKNDV
jgi:hypothetical protein